MKDSELIGKRTYYLKNGEQFSVYLERANGIRTLVSLRPQYGHLVAYIKPDVNVMIIDKLINSFIKKNPGAFLNRDFMVDDQFVFIKGIRKLITANLKNKNNHDFFYVPKSYDVINAYKKQFIDYAYQRTCQWAEKMEIPFDGYKIKAGRFISIYGNCCPSLKTIKYDFRLFAYIPEVFDAIIIHELSHIIYLNHSSKFYDLVYRYCPEYDRKFDMIKKGWFRGELDDGKSDRK